MTMQVGVIGGSGFVGGAVIRRLEARSVACRAVTAPRIMSDADTATSAWSREAATVARLAEQLYDCDVIVNCAGNPDASSQDLKSLFGANGALPGIVAAAARAAGASRYVHVSSAVVQGAALQLDDSAEVSAFSPYARSKIVGEEAVWEAHSPDSTIIYRPPSVHSPERRVTRSIRRLARSPLASVMGPGDAPTPQAHIENVGDAVAEPAVTPLRPPEVVIHPWEGWTTGELMRAFGGGREPRHIPTRASTPIRRLLHAVGKFPRLAANARRVEMMWYGQQQAPSWLTAQGWVPVVERQGWLDMIAEMGQEPQDREDQPHD